MIHLTMRTRFVVSYSNWSEIMQSHDCDHQWTIPVTPAAHKHPAGWQLVTAQLLLMLSPCTASVNSLLPPTTFHWCFHLAPHLSTAYYLQQPFIDAFTLHRICQQLTTSNNLSLMLSPCTASVNSLLPPTTFHWCFHLAPHLSTAYYLQQPFIDAFTLHRICQQLTTSNNLSLMLSPCTASVNSLLPPTTFHWCFHLAPHLSTAYYLQQPFIDAFTLHRICQQLTTSNNLSLMLSPCTASVNSLLPPTTFHWCFHLAPHLSTAYYLQQPFIDAFTLHRICQQLTTSNNLSLMLSPCTASVNSLLPPTTFHWCFHLAPHLSTAYYLQQPFIDAFTLHRICQQLTTSNNLSLMLSPCTASVNSLLPPTTFHWCFHLAPHLSTAYYLQQPFIDAFTLHRICQQLTTSNNLSLMLSPCTASVNSLLPPTTFHWHKSRKWSATNWMTLGDHCKTRLPCLSLISIKIPQHQWDHAEHHWGSLDQQKHLQGQPVSKDLLADVFKTGIQQDGPSSCCTTWRTTAAFSLRWVVHEHCEPMQVWCRDGKGHADGFVTAVNPLGDLSRKMQGTTGINHFAQHL